MRFARQKKILNRYKRNDKFMQRIKYLCKLKKEIKSIMNKMITFMERKDIKTFHVVVTGDRHYLYRHLKGLSKRKDPRNKYKFGIQLSNTRWLLFNKKEDDSNKNRGIDNAWRIASDSIGSQLDWLSNPNYEKKGNKMTNEYYEKKTIAEKISYFDGIEIKTDEDILNVIDNIYKVVSPKGIKSYQMITRSKTGIKLTKEEFSNFEKQLIERAEKLKLEASKKNEKERLKKKEINNLKNIILDDFY